MDSRTDGGASGQTSTSGRQAVVLIDTGEISESVTAFLAGLSVELRSMFVLPSWLSEETLSALPSDKAEKMSPKRQRTGEATYAWQKPEQTRLEELAEDSRNRANQSKVQQKVNEGLRLAELRREP